MSRRTALGIKPHVRVHKPVPVQAADDEDDDRGIHRYNSFVSPRPAQSGTLSVQKSDPDRKMSMPFVRKEAFQSSAASPSLMYF